MNSKFTDQTKVVRFESTEKEPRFVDAYGVAIESADAFEATLQRLGDLAIASNRELESLRRISLYLGTLFREAHAACVQLAFMEMPRAQYIFNRQLFEYYARNRWFLEHKDAAVHDLDLVPKTVYEEVEKNPGAFDAESRQAITDNYAAWAKENPALDQVKHDLPGPTEMVRLALDKPDDFFWYYGYPSVIVHGKTHGIQDVLKTRADGSLERSPSSLGIDRIAEMRRATGFAIQYGVLLALNFDLDQASLVACENTFKSILNEDCSTPETVAVKRYP